MGFRFSPTCCCGSRLCVLCYDNFDRLDATGLNIGDTASCGGYTFLGDPNAWALSGQTLVYSGGAVDNSIMPVTKGEFYSTWLISGITGVSSGTEITMALTSGVDRSLFCKFHFPSTTSIYASLYHGSTLLTQTPEKEWPISFPLPDPINSPTLFIGIYEIYSEPNIYNEAAVGDVINCTGIDYHKCYYRNESTIIAGWGALTGWNYLNFSNLAAYEETDTLRLYYPISQCIGYIPSTGYGNIQKTLTINSPSNINISGAITILNNSTIAESGKAKLDIADNFGGDYAPPVCQSIVPDCWGQVHNQYWNYPIYLGIDGESTCIKSIDRIYAVRDGSWAEKNAPSLDVESTSANSIIEVLDSYKFGKINSSTNVIIKNLFQSGVATQARIDIGYNTIGEDYYYLTLDTEATYINPPYSGAAPIYDSMGTLSDTPAITGYSNFICRLYSNNNGLLDTLNYAFYNDYGSYNWPELYVSLAVNNNEVSATLWALNNYFDNAFTQSVPTYHPTLKGDGSNSDFLYAYTPTPTTRGKYTTRFHAANTGIRFASADIKMLGKCPSISEVYYTGYSHHYQDVIQSNCGEIQGKCWCTNPVNEVIVTITGITANTLDVPLVSCDASTSFDPTTLNGEFSLPVHNIAAMEDTSGNVSLGIPYQKGLCTYSMATLDGQIYSNDGWATSGTKPKLGFYIAVSIQGQSYWLYNQEESFNFDQIRRGVTSNYNNLGYSATKVVVSIFKCSSYSDYPWTYNGIPVVYTGYYPTGAKIDCTGVFPITCGLKDNGQYITGAYNGYNWASFPPTIMVSA